MLVLTFAADGPGNCVIVGGVPYVYARTRFGERVQAAKCPHRGGPLHLADLDDERCQLVCPWHGRRTRFEAGHGRGIASVRRGDRITAVFPNPPDASHELGYRPLAPDLRERVVSGDR